MKALRRLSEFMNEPMPRKEATAILLTIALSFYAAVFYDYWTHEISPKAYAALSENLESRPECTEASAAAEEYLSDGALTMSEEDRVIWKLWTC